MLIFDIETDGLLSDLTCIHCLCVYDDQAKETYVFNDQGNKHPVVRGIQMLDEADCIVGHNIINYDIAAIQKLYPWFGYPTVCIDTLLLSRIYHPNLLEIDKDKKWNDMPPALYGRHSLEAYGYRLGEHKGDYGKTTDWKHWSQELEDYMEQDVKVTHKLWNHFLPYLTSSN